MKSNFNSFSKLFFFKLNYKQLIARNFKYLSFFLVISLNEINIFIRKRIFSFLKIFKNFAEL